MNNYIGISDDKLKHILTVARKCYSLAKEKYALSEEDARKCFVLGFLHDIGYEFSENMSEHPSVGTNILNSISDIELKSIINAIKNHGNVNHSNYSIADYILNEADLSVNAKGENVSVQDRLNDIMERYGEKSSQYKDAYILAKRLNLI
jgi:predicted hydrolase (HD superfamily)